ncbi:MAG: FGGY family carbohydrate kinase, partial [Candidatus Microbacterium stercoravium]
MTSHDVVIGIDLGTTATKVVAYRVDGTSVAEASNGYPLDEPVPGHAEQDPQLILDAICTGLREVVAEVGAEHVRGVSFSSAMHSIMALGSDGEPLTPALTWADTRASALAEKVRGGEGGLALHRRTGTPVHP